MHKGDVSSRNRPFLVTLPSARAFVHCQLLEKVVFFVAMRNRYSAVVQRDGKWFVAYCPEVPEANGQGRTREACLESLAAAIELILDYRREQGFERAPKGAEQTSILV